MYLRRWSIGVVVVLSACAQTTEYQRPDAPVAAQWPQGVEAPGSAEATKLAWRSYFVDPRLQALIAAALDYNRDLRMAVARVAEARAQFKVTDADRFPSFNLTGSGSAGETPADLSGNGVAYNGQRFDLALTTVSYEADFWGRLASLSESAKRNVLSNAEAGRVTRLSLISEVATTYFTELQYDELIRLERTALGSREMSFAVVTRGFKLGAADAMEYQQARAAVESARAELANAEHQRNVTRNKLNFLVGEVPSALPAGLDLDHQGLAATLAVGMPSDVLLVRPDVIAAEQRLIAAHANVDAARAAFFPKVDLTASLGVASASLENLFNGLAWNFQPIIALPLFDGGRLAASRELADIRREIAVADYEKTIQTAFREVADLLSARASLARQLQSARINEDAQVHRMDMVQARHHAGLANVLEVLDVERSLVSAQQNTIQMQRAQLEASAQLYKALGGGA